MPFAATWMNLGIIIVSEVTSYREKQISHGITYMENLKRKWYKWTYLQNRKRLTDTENKVTVSKGERGGRDKLGVWNQQIQTIIYNIDRGFRGGLVIKTLPCNTTDTGSIPDLGRSHMPQGNEACVPQLLKSLLPNNRNHCNKKPMHCN